MGLVGRNWKDYTSCVGTSKNELIMQHELDEKQSIAEFIEKISEY